MNDLLYYPALADLFESDETYQKASTQVRFGYLTLMSQFHWNLLKLLGDVSPHYHLAPPSMGNSSAMELPYLNDDVKFHVNADGISPTDWLEPQTAINLAQVHADCLDSLLCAGSADVASTLLSNVGHTVVIRVVRNALQRAGRRTVDPGVLEETISTLCLLSHRRYEGRMPELAVCLGKSGRRPVLKEPAICFGREFLNSKKSAVLFKGGTLLLRCLSNGRVVEVIELDNSSAAGHSDHILGSLDQIKTLSYSYDQGAVTVALSKQGEVFVSMGARICFSWDASGWRVYPAKRLFDQLLTHLSRVCDNKSDDWRKHLAHHITIIALSLREDRLGGLIIVASNENAITDLTGNMQANSSEVEKLYSQLFVGRQLCEVSPRLACNVTALDGAVVIDGKGIIRGVGCILQTGKFRTAAEGARTRAALFASKTGAALKISQDGEISLFSKGKSRCSFFSPIW